MVCTIVIQRRRTRSNFNLRVCTRRTGGPVRRYPCCVFATTSMRSIRRSRKPKSIKQKQQQEGYVNDKIEDKQEEINNEIKEEAPIEKEKIEKPPPPLKEYTHQQILRGLGL